MNHVVSQLDPDLGALAHVEAALHYTAASAERPFTYTFDPPAGTKRTNIVQDTRLVPIHDLRPIAGTLELDRGGFVLLHAPTAMGDFGDEDAIRRYYYPETERLIAEATGASRVFIFDHTVRRRVHGAEDRSAGTPRQPATRVHVDHTEKSGAQRVRDFFGDAAEELLKGRVQVINLWRPIRGPLRDAPLALCDTRSVGPDDLVASDLIYRDRVGEIYSVRFNPAHRWFYVPEMQRDEALLLKCYDSATDGRSRFMPHSAFEDPTAPADVLPRESIEIRSLVFHPAG
ncbi:CmcJ/NvfI family oxidoreductase [Rhodopila sp.]|jgi:hypothetical protein|uniref:CmcJ/NvfI family oxidoreductase n=1 Tax=Rhodopila sp. TaxID=2480087 RepID=UPI002CB6E7DA|nr:CmcJ/NvfI family oxidoreductase [Rhodopila sp.]HVZ09160.1 CmcJ/NvfI family oxidoreductase [Rhodopila sp.]